MDTLLALLEQASDIVEAAGIPAAWAPNWPVQMTHQVEWMLPALQTLATIAPCHVLDLGTGYGTLAIAAALLGCKVVGIDWHTPLPAARVPGVSWLRQDIESPEPLDECDAVCMLEVLEHCNCHPLPLLRRIRDALRPGGRFIGSTPDPDVWVEDLPPVALEDLPEWHASARPVDRHIRLYQPSEVAGLLRQAGFSGINQRRNGGPRYHWEATR